MEYNDYINFHSAFPDLSTLNNPYSSVNYYSNSHITPEGVVVTPWFKLEKNKFTIISKVPEWIVADNHSSNYNFPLTTPKNIVVKVEGSEVLVNNHPMHVNLTIDPNTGKTLNYLHPARPLTKEDNKQAVSMLRKRITTYKKRARPIYRLLKGSLIDGSNNPNHSGYRGSYRTDELTTHQLYDILKTCKPTTDELDYLLTNGNSSSSSGNGYLSKTDFESAIGRIISRRRSDLRAYALLEVNNDYKTPDEIKNL